MYFKLSEKYNEKLTKIYNFYLYIIILFYNVGTSAVIILIFTQLIKKGPIHLIPKTRPLYLIWFPSYEDIYFFRMKNTESCIT